MNWEFLAVDNEAPALYLLTTAIEAAVPGCHVTPCSSVEEVLAYLAKGQKPVVAFMDIEMPGNHGMELAEKVRSLAPETKLIFVTGYEEYALAAIRIHAEGYLTKPVNAQQIRHELAYLKLLDNNGAAVHIHTFGNFSVEVNGSPITFKRRKSKEALAVLVDRRGAFVSIKELDSIIMEDDQPGSAKLVSVFMSSLVNDLKQANIEELLVRKWGLYAINKDYCSCDYYDFLANPSNGHKYMGAYVQEYSWAEETNAYIQRSIEKYGSQ